MSIARDLARLRTPIQPTYGGVSPGYIDGLNWRWTAANTITVDTGAAWCPYDSSGRVVVLSQPLVVNVPTGTALGVTHLWLHNDSGVTSIVTDDVALSDNYFGGAYRHPTNKGWRYLGSLRRNRVGDVFAQSCFNNYVSFNIHVGQAPFEFLNVTGQVAARTVSIYSVCPGSVTAVTIYGAAGTGALRFAASSNTTAGNTVSSSWFTYVVQGSTYMVFDIQLGRDGIIQYSNDVAGGTNIARITGYHFNR